MDKWKGFAILVCGLFLGVPLWILKAVEVDPIHITTIILAINSAIGAFLIQWGIRIVIYGEAEKPELNQQPEINDEDVGATVHYPYSTEVEDTHEEFELILQHDQILQAVAQQMNISNDSTAYEIFIYEHVKDVNGMSRVSFDHYFGELKEMNFVVCGGSSYDMGPWYLLTSRGSKYVLDKGLESDIDSREI